MSAYKNRVNSHAGDLVEYPTRKANALAGGVGIGAAGVQGDIQFNSAGVFGADVNLFWDDTNNRLGVGTNVPATTIDVRSATAAPGYVTTITNTTNAVGANGLNIKAGTDGAGGGNFIDLQSPNGTEVGFLAQSASGIGLDFDTTIGGGLIRIGGDNASGVRLGTVTSVVGIPGILSAFGSNNFPVLLATNANVGGEIATFINEGAANTSNGILIEAGTNAGTGAFFATFRRPDGTVIGSVQQDAAATVAYNTTSDRRLKSDITDFCSDYDLIDKIRVREFTFNSDSSGHKYVGFVAQELNEVWPYAVTPGDVWGVDYGKLTPLLVKANQDLRKKIFKLEESLQDVRNTVFKLMENQ